MTSLSLMPGNSHSFGHGEELRSREQETLRDLSARKQNLLLELNNYETNQKQGLAGKTGGLEGNEMGVIPAQTQLQTALAINLGSEGKPVS